jgi:hypothetical protein
MAAIHERVFIQAPYVQAVGAFERRLGLADGAIDGECALMLAVPLPDGRDIARDVTAKTHREAGAANFTSTYHIGWPAGSTPNRIPTPGFEGSLMLRAGQDYSECELELKGDYVPPGGVLGKAFDAMVGGRIASATLGALLDGVRSDLREAHEKTEALKHHV